MPVHVLVESDMLTLPAEALRGPRGGWMGQ